MKRRKMPEELSVQLGRMLGISNEDREKLHGLVDQQSKKDEKKKITTTRKKTTKK